MLQATDGDHKLALNLDGTALSAVYHDTQGDAQTSAAPINLNQWQHIAITTKKDLLTLYLNGQAVGNAEINLAATNPSLVIGEGLTGLLDEVQVAKQARSADWIKLQFRSQSPDFTVVNFGQDESGGDTEGPNYFVIILQSLTVDGWVVIALCGVMFVISLLVMIGKGLALKRANKDNAAFLKQYRNVDASTLGSLDRDESEEEREIGDSEFLSSIIGKHDHFQGSPIYHVYHAGVHELKVNFGNSDVTTLWGTSTILSPEALNLVRTRLDAAIVRETQAQQEYGVADHRHFRRSVPGAAGHGHGRHDHLRRDCRNRRCQYQLDCAGYFRSLGRYRRGSCGRYSCVVRLQLFADADQGCDRRHACFHR